MTTPGWNNGSSVAMALALVLLTVAAAQAAPPGTTETSVRPRRLPAIERPSKNEINGDTQISWQSAFATSEVEIVPTPSPVVDFNQVTETEVVPTQIHGGPGEIYLPPSPALDAANRRLRANSECQGQTWIEDYHARIEPNQPPRWWTSDNDEGFSDPPWWDAAVRKPISATGKSLDVDIAALTAGALRYSSFVRAVSANPSIRQAELVSEQAAFDWKAFLESTYDDIDDPVGNQLTTGTDADRYKNRTWGLDTGVRRRNELGGEVEAFQSWGGERDNSRFLDPNPQNTTRLELQYTQPLLRGAGRAYNQSLIVLAKIQLNRSSDAVADDLEDHLVKVTAAYWELYRTRAEFLQRRKLLASAKTILANLEGRREIDAVERQVFRARTAVANRESEMLRAETRIRNTQSQLRLLVNDPALIHAGNQEFMPVDSPLRWEVPIAMSESLHTALLNRPDISQAIRDARAASVKLGVAQQDVLPKLDFLASTYVAGLAAGSQGFRAYGDQFSAGRPSFSLGLQFEVPIGNRAAHAQAKRRQWELNQAMSRFSLTVEEALTSVEVAVREVQTSYREMLAKHKAMNAAQSEADYLNDRWRILPGANDSAAQLLENLLDAQERVADEEQALVSAQVEYALSLIKLKSEMGTLLRIGG